MREGFLKFQANPENSKKKMRLEKVEALWAKHANMVGGAGGKNHRSILR